MVSIKNFTLVKPYKRRKSWKEKNSEKRMGGGGGGGGGERAKIKSFGESNLTRYFRKVVCSWSDVELK